MRILYLQASETFDNVKLLYKNFNCNNFIMTIFFLNIFDEEEEEEAL